MKLNPYVLFFKPGPKLKKELKIAHMDVDPKSFVKRSLMISLQLSVGLCVMLFFLFLRFSVNLLYIPLVFIFLFMMFYSFFLNTPKVYIRRRQREIKEDILFATRYLLVKLESGDPLFNAMTDASKSYGVGGKYFKEIVDDINLGKPIEEAIEYAMEYNASHEFKLVLRQILNSLKTGVNVTSSLRKLLEEITRNHQIEIKAYSRKLNSIILFYLILGCVMPSLGIAMATIFLSMANIVLDLPVLMVVLFFISIIQFTFISIIRSIRPAVDI